LRRAVSTLRDLTETAVDSFEEDESKKFPLLPLKPPRELREVASTLGLTKVARQSLEIADQVPDLLRELADGAREFDPPPSAVRNLLREHFEADDAIVLQFDQDTIDESDDLYATLRQSKAAKLSLKRLPGTHLTPLTQDVFLAADAVAALAKDNSLVAALNSGLLAPRDQWLRQVDNTFTEIDAWLKAPGKSGDKQEKNPADLRTDDDLRGEETTKTDDLDRKTDDLSSKTETTTNTDDDDDALATKTQPPPVDKENLADDVTAEADGDATGGLDDKVTATAGEKEKKPLADDEAEQKKMDD